jgi:membrane-associated protease RseP (regulator of RpoE activity)
VLGVSPSEVTILLHPVALAGWIGIFVTFLNLLPVGQLDGGHVAYALFGRLHRWIARVFLAVILGLGFLGWQGWFLWAVLLGIIGIDHPPTLDTVTALDGRRRVAGWATVALFVLTFIPVPFTISMRPLEEEPPRAVERVVPPGPVAVARSVSA